MIIPTGLSSRETWLQQVWLVTNYIPNTYQYWCISLLIIIDRKLIVTHKLLTHCPLNDLADILLMIQPWFRQWLCSESWDQWASYQIRKIAGCACAGNAGNVFPRRRFHRKPLVSDPGMHHGTCVTHVPWCMSESLTCGDGENVFGIPGACAPAILRIW